MPRCKEARANETTEHISAPPRNLDVHLATLPEPKLRRLKPPSGFGPDAYFVPEGLRRENRRSSGSSSAA